MHETRKASCGIKPGRFQVLISVTGLLKEGTRGNNESKDRGESVLERVLIAPGRYIQGPGLMRRAGEFVRPLAPKALVIADRFILGTMGEWLQEGFNASRVDPVVEEFIGECSRPEIDRLTEIGRTQECGVVVGIGGGKAIDTAKAVAHAMKVSVAVAPTIAATDAPCSALSVIYTPEGVFAEYLVLPQNPDLVLVDTAVIAQAPARFLVAGMGDALATVFEAEACARSGARTLAGGTPTLSALSLARLCYDTILEYGLLARLAVEKGAVTPAVEKVIEANTLLSGLGFESGGLAAAHAIHNGFTALPATHGRYHGEKVAFATIVQLVMEDRPPEEIYEVLEFCNEVGLPMTLNQLGIQGASREDLQGVAEASTAHGETIHNMPFKVTPDIVVNAILAADALGNSYLDLDRPFINAPHPGQPMDERAVPPGNFEVRTANHSDRLQ